MSKGLSAPSRRGVPGVRGLLVDVGVPGTGARLDLGLTVLLARDSEETEALYFLCVDERRLGVVERPNLASISEIEPLEDVEDVDSGFLGVNMVSLESLLPAGVLGTTIVGGVDTTDVVRIGRELISTVHVLSFMITT
jgi:hypothetical protein